MDWIYANEYGIFKKGTDVQRLHYRHYGYCNKSQCNCAGSATYSQNEDYDSDSAELEEDGYIFSGFESVDE